MREDSRTLSCTHRVDDDDNNMSEPHTEADGGNSKSKRKRGGGTKHHHARKEPRFDTFVRALIETKPELAAVRAGVDISADCNSRLSSGLLGALTRMRRLIGVVVDGDTIGSRHVEAALDAVFDSPARRRAVIAYARAAAAKYKADHKKKKSSAAAAAAVTSADDKQ